MYCPNCGVEISDQSDRCVQCGADLSAAGGKKGWSTCLIVGIVLAVLGVVMLPIIGILAAIAVPNFLHAQLRARVATVQAEQRNLAVALESFRVFEGRLPTVAEFYDGTRLSDPPPAGVAPTPAERRTLTSPVSHIAALPGDPFREREYHYGYWTNGKIWILRSVGPDRQITADLSELGEALEAMSPPEMGRPRDWPQRLLNMLYDPTNGITSDGDIIKTGP